MSGGRLPRFNFIWSPISLSRCARNPSVTSTGKSFVARIGWADALFPERARPLPRRQRNSARRYFARRPALFMGDDFAVPCWVLGFAR